MSINSNKKNEQFTENIVNMIDLILVRPPPTWSLLKTIYFFTLYFYIHTEEETASRLSVNRFYQSSIKNYSSYEKLAAKINNKIYYYPPFKASMISDFYLM